MTSSPEMRLLTAGEIDFVTGGATPFSISSFIPAVNAGPAQGAYESALGAANAAAAANPAASSQLPAALTLLSAFGLSLA